MEWRDGPGTTRLSRVRSEEVEAETVSLSEKEPKMRKGNI